LASPPKTAAPVPEGTDSTVEAWAEAGLGCVATYAWLRDGILISGETTGVLTLLRTSPSVEGDYAAVLHSCAGSFTSAVVRVRVDVPFRLGSAAGFENAGFGLTLAGNDGQPFFILASDDLLDWTNIFADAMTGHVYHFTDTNSYQFPRRYYQARPGSPTGGSPLAPASSPRPAW
jgi:hypothetical protein